MFDTKDAIDTLCDSCTNKACMFQSGIQRSKCDFYIPPMPHLEPDNCGNYVVQQEPSGGIMTKEEITEVNKILDYAKKVNKVAYEVLKKTLERETSDDRMEKEGNNVHIKVINAGNCIMCGREIKIVTKKKNYKITNIFFCPRCERQINKRQSTEADGE